MRHEVIKLTDGAIYPELIKLLSGNGDVWGDMLAEYKHKFKILFQNGRWTRAYPQYKADYTITDVDFIQKYGENTAPEPAPAWTFKTDEELAEMMIAYHDQIPSKRKSALDFLTSIRKPAFELVCQDGVVTDPAATVWYLNDSFQIEDTVARWGKVNELVCFGSKSAIIDYRHNNTPAIKLSDLIYDAESDSYYIGLNAAHKLINERINGK